MTKDSLTRKVFKGEYESNEGENILQSMYSYMQEPTPHLQGTYEVEKPIMHDKHNTLCLSRTIFNKEMLTVRYTYNLHLLNKVLNNTSQNYVMKLWNRCISTPETYFTYVKRQKQARGKLTNYFKRINSFANTMDK